MANDIIKSKVFNNGDEVVIVAGPEPDETDADYQPGQKQEYEIYAVGQDDELLLLGAYPSVQACVNSRHWVA
jgi:hypothetical protein